MPRTPNPDRPQRLVVNLPTSIFSRIAGKLFSEVEGRVPYGAWSEFLSERAREHLEWKQVDLQAYGFAPGFFVRGPKEMVEELENKLKDLA